MNRSVDTNNKFAGPETQLEDIQTNRKKVVAGIRNTEAQLRALRERLAQYTEDEKAANAEITRLIKELMTEHNEGPLLKELHETKDRVRHVLALPNDEISLLHAII